MSDSNQNSTVLVITTDVLLLSSLLEGNTTNYEFISRESIQAALADSDLLTNNHIVIIDIDSVSGGKARVIEHTLQLKKADPTQVVMMVGEAEPLSDLLKSNIQPLIFRAFNKPIHPNQIFLAFGSASKLHLSLIDKQSAGEDLLAIGPLENKTNIDNIAAQQKSKSAIYAGIGVLVLGIAAWLFLGNKTDTNTELPTSTLISSTPAEIESTLVTTNDDVTKINQLNQEAAQALLDGRQVSPPDDNALFYYDQVLIIDPYDLTAYEGKKNIVAELKNSYAGLVANAEFDKAFETIDALQAIEPLDTSNLELRQNLETEISNYVDNMRDSGTAADIEETTTLLAKLGSQSQNLQAAAAALQNEKNLLANIDQALANNNLIPPNAGNAYSIVSEALQKNTISRVNFAPRISTLSEKLLLSANSSLEADNLEEAETFAALVKRLNVDPQNLAALESKIEQRKTALAAEALPQTSEQEQSDELAEQGEEQTDGNEEVEEEAEAKQAKIIPAKLISRAAPRYPSRALDRNIEGWVSIGFVIDTDGVPVDIKIVESEPEKTFDAAAIAAVKKWRFSPAMNEDTQESVSSVVQSTKLQFKLSD